MAGYELVEQDLDPSRGLSILVLGREGEEETFIDRLAHDHRRRVMAAAIARASLRLAERGTRWALDNQVLKRLRTARGSIAIYELKVNRTKFRVMTYLHNDSEQTPVLLFEFVGHEGRSRGGIREETIERGVRLATIACDLMRGREEGER